MRLSPRAVSRLAIFYVLFFVPDFLIFSSGLTLLDRRLRVTAHLALFTAVIKLYARFAISTLVSFEIKHSMEDSARKVNGPVVAFPVNHPALERAVGKTTLGSALEIVAVASFLFFTIPCYRSGYLTGLGMRP